MSKLKYALIFFTCCLIFISCQQESGIGIEIQPQSDKIQVETDTFHIFSENNITPAISAQCTDTLSTLLGEYFSRKYGNIKAELIVQLAPPVGYKFPDAEYEPKPDSVVLVMYYRKYLGSPTEPIEISIYELNKGTPDYYKQYKTNMDLSQFVDINDQQLLGKTITTSAKATQNNEPDEYNKTSDFSAIRYKFTDEQTLRFFNIPSSAYKNNEEFLKYFKGLYITTSYGKSTMLYLHNIALRLYYHYSYNSKNSENKDTTITVNSYLTFPANKDMRMLNKITYKPGEEVINNPDTINHITSGATCYPKITLPIGKIKKSIESKIGDKNLKESVFINSATISIETIEQEKTAEQLPIPTALYMIPEEQLDSFITSNYNNSLKENQSQVGLYSTDTKSYSFDIARLINKKIKGEKEIKETDKVTFVILPVTLFTDAATNAIVSMRPAKSISGITIRSGKNEKSPLRLELSYSVF